MHIFFIHNTRATVRHQSAAVPPRPTAVELIVDWATLNRVCTRTRTCNFQVEVIEKGESERRAVDDKKRKEEVDFLKYQGQHLDSFLKQIGGSK